MGQTAISGAAAAIASRGVLGGKVHAIAVRTFVPPFARSAFVNLRRDDRDCFFVFAISSINLSKGMPIGTLVALKRAFLSCGGALVVSDSPLSLSQVSTRL